MKIITNVFYIYFTYIASPQRNLIQPIPIINSPKLRSEMSVSVDRFINVNRCGPTPLLPTTYLIVNTAHFEPFFIALRQAILFALTPGVADAPENYINEVDFVRVCRYIVKSRCDYVFGIRSGEHREGMISILEETLIPKALADITNGIGVVMIQDGAYTVCPEPEAEAAVEAERIVNLVDNRMLATFEILVSQAEKRGVIRTDKVGHEIAGTCWWTLGVITLNNAVADGNVQSVRVTSTFTEVEDIDVVQAAVVQRNYLGLLPTEAVFFMMSGTLRGISSTRKDYCLNA